MLLLLGTSVNHQGGSMLMVSSPFSGHTMTQTIGLLLMIAGGVLLVLAIVQAYKERMELNRNNMGGKKPVTAAMGMQAQAEYNRRLAAYSKEGVPADEKAQAKLFAQAILTLSLGAPSTAVFSDLDAAAAGSNGTYRVTGWVDAQNIFGVMMRESFSMRVFNKDGVWQTGR
jgi:hypothetical protein